jgi:hypothetical protein
MNRELEPTLVRVPISKPTARIANPIATAIFALTRRAMRSVAILREAGLLELLAVSDSVAVQSSALTRTRQGKVTSGTLPGISDCAWTAEPGQSSDGDDRQPAQSCGDSAVV